MRFLIVLLVVLAGCVATIPTDARMTSDLACEAARAVVQLRAQIAPSPKPPAPAPSGKCSQCSGTGKLPTDGRVVVTCPRCGGTGNEPKSVLIRECPDGSCRL